MPDRKKAAPGPAEATAAPAASRSPWTAPRTRRLATSAAETGGASTLVDGVEAFS